jgi:hypothetical protein
MSQEPIEALLRAAVARDLDESKLASLTSEYQRAASGDFLSAFAEFIARSFVAGKLDFLTANAALNQVMPVAGFERAPMQFWVVYVAMEDFETVSDPDAKAWPSIRDLVAAWDAA